MDGSTNAQTPAVRGLTLVIFDKAMASRLGGCVLPRGAPLVHLTGRVLPGFACEGDCCGQALVRLRVQARGGRGRFPARSGGPGAQRHVPR